MKKVTILVVLVLIVLWAAIIYMVTDIASPELGVFVSVILMLRYFVPLVLIAAALFTLWKLLGLYTTLTKEEQGVIHKLACPIIDAGIHEAKKRSDKWGKLARLASRYRRFARKY